jgi:hypothetical protein
MDNDDDDDPKVAGKRNCAPPKDGGLAMVGNE